MLIMKLCVIWKVIISNLYIIFSQLVKRILSQVVIVYNQLKKYEEKYKEFEKAARAESSEYRYTPKAPNVLML